MSSLPVSRTSRAAKSQIHSTEQRKPTAADADTGYVSGSLWLSSNAEKCESEFFFLRWSIVWVSLMAYIVASRWFESFTPWHYMATGVFIAFPPVLIPALFPGPAARSVPLLRRYSTKANVYIFVLSWNANYFWTHYFYTVLRATYTFEAHRLNEVPFALYLITHSYFHLYHVLSSMALRRLWRAFADRRSVRSFAIVFFFLCAFSYAVAFMETFTIQNFPHYDIPDRSAMYLFGSVFYGLYFMISFPMFLRLDENSNSWSIGRAFIDSMAASMMITQLLDFWRISIGTIVDKPAARPAKQPVPFVY